MATAKVLHVTIELTFMYLTVNVRAGAMRSVAACGRGRARGAGRVGGVRHGDVVTEVVRRCNSDS